MKPPCLTQHLHALQQLDCAGEAVPYSRMQRMQGLWSTVTRVQQAAQWARLAAWALALDLMRGQQASHVGLQAGHPEHRRPRTGS